ncbi:MAG: S9 family peptidase [Lentimicrobium sp.]|jgi:dipeptidyl aminopeptidase/acylaminoacyl peptidase|nr:S9 family peptidase [Lentimicrobium sp.]
MKTLKILLIAMIMTTFANLLPAQESKLPPLLDRELFFDNPEISGAQLSPDGTYFSFIKPYNDVMNIWVKKFDEPFDEARPITADVIRPIRSYFWSRDGKYILYSQDKGGDENFNIYAVDPSQKPASDATVPENRDLTNLKGVRVQIYAVPKTEPDALYIGLNDRDPAWHDLYKMKISTGERTLIRQNSAEDRITGWVFDWDDNLRIANRANMDGSNELLLVNQNSFTPIYMTNIFETAYPVGFDKNNNNIYLVTNKGDDVDLTRLVLFDLKTLKEELIETDPENKVDLGNVSLSEVSRDIIFTSYEDEHNRIYFKNQGFELDYKLIKRQLPEREIYFARSTADEQHWIIGSYSDVDPGSTYLYDRKTQKLTFQYTPRPNIPVEHMAPMKAISYKSSDGTIIPAYLTLPKGMEAKNLPLVVFPHGGPWARSGWGFNGYAQFLANRGYAVLDPNFRASTGYGKKFINAGNKEWGRKMQDDITWGVKHLVDQGIVDPEKVGIMGGSYGGYATLAGLAFTPDIYACGVSIVGPSNLITLLNSLPPYWEAGRKVFYTRMGDPTTEEGKADLEKMSPLFSADKITSPLLVIQGANDPRVNKHESDQIVVALRDRGFPVEYIVAPDEGHGFARPVNNLAMNAAAEKFLAKYLGGRYQESMKPEVAERLKEITVDPETVTLQETEK